MKSEHEQVLRDAEALVRTISLGEGSDAFVRTSFENKESAWQAAADDGVPEAQVLVGRLHEHGLGRDRDTALALEWYRRAAEAGHPLGQFALGLCCHEGPGAAQDSVAAVSWYRKAAEQGFSPAQCNLGRHLMDGLGTEVAWSEAVRWFERAAEAGNAVAQYNLATCYDFGEGVEEDPDAALSWYRKSADAGYVEAIVSLAECFETGNGVPVDEDKARTLFERAAAQDHPDALYSLSFYDDQQAETLLARAAELGHAEAQFNSGMNAVRRGDVTSGIAFFRQAALQRHPDAMLSMGVAYARGDGVDKSLGAAAEWFERAAKLGAAGARRALLQVQRQLGLLPSLDESINGLLDALVRNASEEITTFARQVTEADVEDNVRLNEAVAQLLPWVMSAAPETAGLLALSCGALVESGADPAPLAGVLLERLPDVLQQATTFIEACADREAERGEEARPDDPEAVREEVEQQLLEEAGCWHALDTFYLPAVSIYSVDCRARASAQRNEELCGAIATLSPHHHGAHYLEQLLAVLDDEPLVVLHVPAGRGYELRISGVADNFQLHVLLADLLIGDPADGWLEGDAPDPGVISVFAGEGPQQIDDLHAVGVWNLYQWTALGPDATLPEEVGLEHWVWGEGVPGDIHAFKGKRTLLLGPPNYARSWNASRTFDLLEPDVYIEEVLTAEEVDRLLGEISKGVDVKLSRGDRV